MYCESNCSQAIPFNQRSLSLMRHVSGYKSFLFDMRYYGSNQTEKHKGNMQQDADQELLGCPPTLVYHFPNPNIQGSCQGKL